MWLGHNSCAVAMGNLLHGRGVGTIVDNDDFFNCSPVRLKRIEACLQVRQTVDRANDDAHLFQQFARGLQDFLLGHKSDLYRSPRAA